MTFWTHRFIRPTSGTLAASPPAYNASCWSTYTPSAAFELRRGCQGARTPALGDTDPRVRLNPGELDTARLAAAGHSNRDIAAQLHVSIRTVENRLQRAYEKLGISGRTGLAAALDRVT